MPAIERVIPLVGQLPASIRDALARRLRELAGLGLIALSGVAAAALMTWSVQDPSLSHATSRAIRNIVGYPGAIGADLLMQILGLGAIMLILPIAVWGWRMLTHRTFDREALRIACWILCTVISAGFASCWPHGGAWPLPTGLGGVVGDALVRAPAVVFGPPGFVYRLVLGLILFAAAAGDLPDRERPRLAAAGRGIDRRSRTTTRRSWKKTIAARSRWDGCSMPLMSAKARLWLVVDRWPIARWSQARRRRARPRSNARSPVSAAAPRRRWPRGVDDDFDDEDEDEEEDAPPAPRARRPPPARRRANHPTSSNCRRCRC